MLSAVVLTKNEEKNIERCLENLSFCDEIVVVDDYSEDGTVKIIQKLKIKYQNDNSKIKIFQRSLNNNFSAQRNFGLAKSSGDWVLFVDADEVVSESLASEISNFKFPISNFQGFYIKRRDIMWSRELRYGEVGDVRVLRLAKKGVGKWKRRVHEYWDVEGKTATLESPLLHYPHQTLLEFASHVNFYSTLHAQQKFEDGENSSILKIYFWPKLKFIKNYVWHLGFLDGTEGFVYAAMMSFHSFLAWSKLWLLQNRRV